ncbi:MAG: sulfoxide reductase heme-binding subunit YedZ [Gammaproteobacteria bacterium]|nr:sulfoxide reductase heme-binding subunit YedZ [Gammaproteobacteria bacterium]
MKTHLLFIVACLPAVYYVGQVVLLLEGQDHALGADPGKALVEAFGGWTLNLLVLTLAVSPVRRWSGWNRLIRYRRMLGLFCFFYALAHLGAYLAFILNWRWSEIWQELQERPYILMGFAAFIGLVPLAVTSSKWTMRRLAGNWIKLHRLVYLVAVLAVMHLIWLTRADYKEAFLYSLLVVVLLGDRVYIRFQRAFRAPVDGGQKAAELAGFQAVEINHKVFQKGL